MPVHRTGLCGSLYVTVIIAMFTERITRNDRITHMMQYSLHLQNVEGRLNLDPWGMDTCVGCRIIEYLLSTVFLLCLRPRAKTWVHVFYYN